MLPRDIGMLGGPRVVAPSMTLQSASAVPDLPDHPAERLVRQLREAGDKRTVQLPLTVARDQDAVTLVTVNFGRIVGPQTVQMLDARADQVVLHLTNEPSWPTLRAHLLALAAETGKAPTPAPANSGRRSRTTHGRRHGRRAGLAPPRARTDRPRAASLASPFQKRSMIIPFGTNIWRSVPN
jgi:hypothetical protein